MYLLHLFIVDPCLDKSTLFLRYWFSSDWFVHGLKVLQSITISKCLVNSPPLGIVVTTMEAPNVLELQDLEPRESQFSLKDFPEKKFTLRRWSLRVKAWASTNYGSERLQQIFQHLKIDEIAEIAWYMLKDDDKKTFGDSQDEFLDHICSVKDQLAVITAMLETLGIGEPEMKKLQAAKEKRDAEQKAKTPDPNQSRPRKKTGAKSLTR